MTLETFLVRCTEASGSITFVKKGFPLNHRPPQKKQKQNKNKNKKTYLAWIFSSSDFMNVAALFHLPKLGWVQHPCENNPTVFGCFSAK